MGSFNDDLEEYTRQLHSGKIQRAYRGIMTFMSELKAHLEAQHPDYASGTMYFGYMDMTYFAFTPPVLRDKKLKIAVVYLHEEARFELWLAAANRKIQGDYMEKLRHIDLGGYTLSQAAPGVDAIIAASVALQTDFDYPNEMKDQIEAKVRAFIVDMITLSE